MESRLVHDADDGHRILVEGHRRPDRIAIGKELLGEMPIDERFTDAGLTCLREFASSPQSHSHRLDVSRTYVNPIDERAIVLLVACVTKGSRKPNGVHARSAGER